MNESNFKPNPWELPKDYSEDWMKDCMQKRFDDDTESKSSRRYQMLVIYSASALVSLGWSGLCFWVGYWMAGG